MQTLSEATRRYLSKPDGDNFDTERVHLAVSEDLESFTADFFHPSPLAPGGRQMPTWVMDSWVRGFPESRKLHNKDHNTIRLELPCTDMVVERLNSCILASNITFEDGSTRLAYNSVLLRGVQADSNARVYAEYKADKTVPEHNLIHSEEFPLAGYQQVALVNTVNSTAYSLFMQQGTGKTPIIIAKICNAAVKLDRVHRSIIVCPKNVKANWKSEFKKFGTCPGKVTILHGTETDRVRQLILAFVEIPGEDKIEYTTVICSYETLARSWRIIELILSKQEGGMWDEATLDESHYIKSERTKRYKYCMKLRDLSTSRSVLTGTPVTNTALDLFTQFEFLGKGLSGFRTFKAFQNFFQTYRIDDSTGRQVVNGMQNVPFLQERLARYAFLVTVEEVLTDLPSRTYDIVNVGMTDKQLGYYKQLRDQLSLEADEDLANPGALSRQMVVKNVLVKMLKLAQITSGYVSWSAVLDEDTGDEVSPASLEALTPDNKLDELVDILKAKGPNDKTIVWSCWVLNLTTIHARLREEGIDSVLYYGKTNDDERAEAVRRFNEDPKCKVFIGNPAAGGTGLNLLGYPPEGSDIYGTTGFTTDDWLTDCTHVIYYSQNWSPTARSQSEARCYRRGTRKPVRVTDLVVAGTIDSEIREVVLAKHKSAQELTDLQKILDNVLKGELDVDLD